MHVGDGGATSICQRKPREKQHTCGLRSEQGPFGGQIGRHALHVHRIDSAISQSTMSMFHTDNLPYNILQSRVEEAVGYSVEGSRDDLAAVASIPASQLTGDT